MTNEQIILQARFQLMEVGQIGTTGKIIFLENEKGEKQKLMEPEEIHTFSGWKALGYSVKKGEHAIAKFPIWKHAVKKAETEEGECTEKMFKTQAFFFSMEQVRQTEGGEKNECTNA